MTKAALSPLQKLLKRREGAKFCTDLIALDGGAIVDEAGNVWFGRDGGGDRHPVTWGEERIWVVGSAAAARLLQQFVTQEIDKKRLAEETLDKYREINLLYRLSEELTASFDVKVLARLILAEAQKLVRGTGGSLMLWQSDTQRLQTVEVFGKNMDAAFTLELDRSIAGRVFGSGKGEIVNDVTADPQFLPTNAPVASLICVPLKAGDRPIGVVNFYHNPAILYTAQDLQLLSALAAQGAQAIENTRLHNRELRDAVMRNEIEKGRKMQQDFLPDRLMQVPGWEIATAFRPAREVAGDFYDVFALPSGGIGLVIADVCDKGVGSALFMALFRSLIRVFAQETILSGLAIPMPGLTDGKGQPVTLNLDYVNALRAVRLTNDYVANTHSNLNMFATLFFGVLDPKTGVLSYVNGGHEPLVLVQDGQIQQLLKPTGPAVGMLPNLHFQIQQVHLQVGDRLVGYTDGVPEAKNPSGAFYTEKRLLALLNQPFATVTDTIAAIETDVLQHIDTADQFDDITLLGVARLDP
ncbi:MAG: PP2C family protein-serine/threonine phosphatase [Pseudanabaenaceae cyanobacterium]